MSDTVTVPKDVWDSVQAELEYLRPYQSIVGEQQARIEELEEKIVWLKYITEDASE